MTKRKQAKKTSRGALGSLAGTPLEHDMQAKRQISRARKHLAAEGCENAILALGFAAQAAAEGVWVSEEHLSKEAQRLQRKAALRVQSKCGCKR